MKAIIVDDEIYTLRYIEGLCRKIPGLHIAGCFDNAAQAIKFTEEQEIDLVFTDINMPVINGLEAVRKIRQIRPETAVVFITGCRQYALEAFQLDAVSYILKPCGIEDLKSAVKRAGRLLPEKKKQVEIVTFGYFMIKIDGVPLRLSNSKAEELVALLVDREGAPVTLEQATGILWEGRPYDDAVKRLYRKATGYLNQLFHKMDIHFFESNRGSSHVIPTEFDCDYYRLLAGDAQARKRYCGAYMAQYSWAEPTIGRIQNFF